MISFVNAKLNLGLNIVSRRPDGYHDLETVFYPVGRFNGTPRNPEPLCDILEITPAESTQFRFTGRTVDCPLEKNLVYKAWKAFHDSVPECPELNICLEKHLPDGAGLGGGSADASFTLRMLNDYCGSPLDLPSLEIMALSLGADCPVFIRNVPSYAEGVGEKLEAVGEVLKNWWCVIVKPDIYVSTREAFAGVTPRRPSVPLREIYSLPVEAWQGLMVNDFEVSLFPSHPVLADIKGTLLGRGAVYAAMSGSGSSLFGLFRTREMALNALGAFPSHFTAISLL